MRYQKAPIVEAAIDFRWQPPWPLDAIRKVVSQPTFSVFEAPKERKLVNARIDLHGGQISHDSKDVGFELTLEDGSELVLLEADKFVYVQRAPYDNWEFFSQRALSFLGVVVAELNILEFDRIGLRFINRIDIPHAEGATINTDDYISVKFDGPRADRGIVQEFQMRVVKPTLVDGLSYALTVATAQSPLDAHSAIVLDIDVFTEIPIPAAGDKFNETLLAMRAEKNDIFHSCLKPAAIKLFGEVKE